MRALGSSVSLGMNRPCWKASRAGSRRVGASGPEGFCLPDLPFKRFPANAAFYYTMLVAFFLYESFKQDVCDPVVRP